MSFFPQFSLGILNGIIPFGLYILVFSITMLTFNKDVRARLYEKGGMSKRQTLFFVITKLIALVNIITILFSRLVFGNICFIVGIVVYVLGLSVFIISLITYSKISLDKPVRDGIYKLSRNPQMIGIWSIFLGIGLMIGSVATLLLLTVGIITSHQSTLAEEQFCLRAYGSEYERYMREVPRYIFIKTKF